MAFYFPLALMFPVSVSGKERLLVYVGVLSNAVYTRVILYSAYIALLTTLATLALSLPAAYYLAFHAPEKHKATLVMAFNVLMLFYYANMELGFLTVLIGHTAYNVAFAYVALKPQFAVTPRPGAWLAGLWFVLFCCGL